MNITTSGSEGFAIFVAECSKGEVLYTQPKVMLSMTTGFLVSAHIGGSSSEGGVRGGVKSLLSGESFSLSRYESKRDGEQLTLAPTHIGEIRIVNLDGAQGYYLTKGAYIAHEEGVVLTPRYGGLKGWVSKKGFFLLHISGKGRVCLAGHGAILSKELIADEIIVVDNEFVLAFSDSIQYELRTVTKKLSHSLLSGEGLVNRYRGPGTIFYQTRARTRPGIVSTMLNIAT
jgi:uncharacterized protein (TIGR00266 family)